MNPTKLTGETGAQAIATALHDRLERTHGRYADRSLADKLDEIALHCASLPVLDDSAADDIPSYDEFGLPARRLSTRRR